MAVTRSVIVRLENPAGRPITGPVTFVPTLNQVLNVRTPTDMVVRVDDALVVPNTVTLDLPTSGVGTVYLFPYTAYLPSGLLYKMSWKDPDTKIVYSRVIKVLDENGVRIQDPRMVVLEPNQKSEPPRGVRVLNTDELDQVRDHLEGWAPQIVDAVDDELGGTDWQGGQRAATVTLSPQDIVDLYTTRIRVIPAQGAGTFIIPGETTFHRVGDTRPIGTERRMGLAAAWQHVADDYTYLRTERDIWEYSMNRESTGWDCSFPTSSGFKCPATPTPPASNCTRTRP